MAASSLTNGILDWASQLDPSWAEILAAKSLEASQFLKENHKIIGTINDIIPEKIGEFEVWFKQSIISSFIKDSYRLTEENLKKISPDYSMDTLYSAKRAEVDAFFKKQGKRTAALRLRAFHQGATFVEISKIRADMKYPTITSHDFINCVHPAINIAECKNQGLKSKLETREKVEAKRQELQTKLRAQKMIVTFLPNDLILEKLKTCSMHISQLCQIKFYINSSQSKNKSIEQLCDWEIENEDTRDNMLDSLDSFVQEAEFLQKNESEKAFKELIDEEGKYKKTRRNANPQNQMSAPTSKVKEEDEKEILVNCEKSLPVQKTCFEEQIEALHQMKNPEFRVHPRITRWAIAKVEKIREFEDTDPVAKVRVKQYAKLSPAELTIQKAHHNLAGIERLISNPAIRDRFTYSYDSAEQGRATMALFALKTQGNKKESGIVFLGVDSARNLIYHAMFQPLTEAKITSQPIVQATQIFQNIDLTLKEKDPWNQTNHFHFSSGDNNTLIMDIGKSAQDRVSFQFYPLKNERVHDDEVSSEE
jgi:hypothetical protein